MDGYKSDIAGGISLALKLFLHRRGAREEEVTQTQEGAVVQSMHMFYLPPLSYGYRAQG